MTEKPFVSEPLLLPDPEDGEYSRADLKFFGIDHSGPSYEARVYLNNRKATEATARDEQSGYVGSFTILGHGGCFGDVGHCDVPTEAGDLFDLRLPHPLTPATKTIIATEAIRRLRDGGAGEVTVTVVPVVRDTNLPTGREARGAILKFESLSLVTYQ